MTHRNAFALAGRKLFGTLTLGDADVLPRAKCFWAFSPRVSRSKTMSLRSKLFSPRGERQNHANTPLHSHERIEECNDTTPCRDKSVKRYCFKKEKIGSWQGSEFVISVFEFWKLMTCYHIIVFCDMYLMY